MHIVWNILSSQVFRIAYIMMTSWRRQMETFSALLALCAGNSPVTGEFSSQRPVTRSFDVFFDLRLNKRLSKQSWGWWFETPMRSLWFFDKITSNIFHPYTVDDEVHYVQAGSFLVNKIHLVQELPAQRVSNIHDLPLKWHGPFLQHAEADSPCFIKQSYTMKRKLWMVTLENK